MISLNQILFFKVSLFELNETSNFEVLFVFIPVPIIKLLCEMFLVFVYDIPNFPFDLSVITWKRCIRFTNISQKMEQRYGIQPRVAFTIR